MFKELLRAWRGESLVNDVLEVFDGMLEDAESMYDPVAASLFEADAPLPERDAIYQIDRRINSAERDSRRMLAEHLAISQADVGACLILMSTIKDAERLGDYAKNLFEVRELAGGALEADAYSTELSEVAAGLRESFREVRLGFRSSDADRCRAVIERHGPLLKRCDELLPRLLADEVSTAKAVSYTLVARHLKRIGSHLGNIASSVVLPMHQIHYTSKMR